MTTTLSGRLWESQMACRLVFMPPLVRPITDRAPLFDARTGRRAMGLQVGGVDHHGHLLAVFSGKTRHHPGEDTLTALALPTVVESLVRSKGGRGVA